MATPALRLDAPPPADPRERLETLISLRLIAAILRRRGERIDEPLGRALEDAMRALGCEPVRSA